MLADSLILASANLGVIGLVYLGKLTRITDFAFGSLAHALLVLASPVLLLATVIYLPRDLFRRGTRLEALIALVLLIPAGMFVYSIRVP